MFSISLLSAVFLLALVLYEVQILTNSVLLAAHWPSTVKPLLIPTSASLQKVADVSGAERVRLALARYAYASLIFHEIQSAAFRHEAKFKSTPSLGFGLLVWLGSYFMGLAFAEACSLAFAAGCVLFFSSQTRKFLRFNFERGVHEEQLSRLINQPS